MKAIIFLTAACANYLACLPAQAALQVTINNFSTTQIDFSVVGTIDSGATIGSSFFDTLYLGEPGNTTWITGPGPISVPSNNGSPDNTAFLATTSDSPNNIVGIIMNTGIAPNQTIDFDVSLPGSFAPGNINTNNMIISAGFNGSELPDPGTQVGVVPEPAAYATLLGISAAGVILLRRKAIR
jgi:hypothetical protein